MCVCVVFFFFFCQFHGRSGLQEYRIPHVSTLFVKQWAHVLTGSKFATDGTRTDAGSSGA